MVMTQPIVVAAFHEPAQVDQAVNDLRNAGFGEGEVKNLSSGAATGGVLESIKSAFTGKEGTSSNVYDELRSMAVPEADATFFQREADAGRTIVTVMTNDRQAEATAILARYGGYGASAARTSQTADYTSTRDTVAQDVETTGTAAQNAVTGTEGAQRLQLREEQLRAQKQQVQTGEVRLGKDVVSEQQTLNVPTTREEVYIERRPGSGQMSDTPIGEGEVINVPVREEQVTVEKQPFVREEISLGKRQVQENQQVSDTVHREEARIERSGDVNVQDANVDNLSNDPESNA